MKKWRETECFKEKSTGRKHFLNHHMRASQNCGIDLTPWLGRRKINDRLTDGHQRIQIARWPLRDDEAIQS
eukprot:scaffold289691_cov37-Prasinocladus_malaysianus.AAC.1